MIISTSRSRLGFVIDTVLTLLAWAGFLYLFGAGILSILRGALTGPDVPLWSAFLPTAGTLLAYVLVAGVNAAILAGWAAYNYRRFAGMDRRRPMPAIGVSELARSFGVDADCVRACHAAKVAVIRHDETGRIVGVSQADDAVQGA